MDTTLIVTKLRLKNEELREANEKLSQDNEELRGFWQSLKEENDELRKENEELKEQEKPSEHHNYQMGNYSEWKRRMRNLKSRPRQKEEE